MDGSSLMKKKVSEVWNEANTFHEVDPSPKLKGHRSFSDIHSNLAEAHLVRRHKAPLWSLMWYYLYYLINGSFL